MLLTGVEQVTDEHVLLVVSADGRAEALAAREALGRAVGVLVPERGAWRARAVSVQLSAQRCALSWCVTVPQVRCFIPSLKP